MPMVYREIRRVRLVCVTALTIAAGTGILPALGSPSERK